MNACMHVYAYYDMLVLMVFFFLFKHSIDSFQMKKTSQNIQNRWFTFSQKLAIRYYELKL